jgi:hypothetical protein
MEFTPSQVHRPSFNETDPLRTFQSLPFMQFKDDMVNALKRLKFLIEKEKTLEAKLQAFETQKRKDELERKFLLQELEKKERDNKGSFHDQADAKWKVITGLLRGHNDTPCRPVGRP